MKRVPKSLRVLLCIPFLAIAFYACSDNSLDSEINEQSVAPFCYVEAEDKCYNVVESVCAQIGGKSMPCPGSAAESSSSALFELPSSSSEGDSSSSIEGDSSSSDDDDSSSSTESDSSSSAEDGDSSSSSEPLSSSSHEPAPAPITNCGTGYANQPNTCETFRFRNFDYDSENRIFSKNKNMYAANSVDGTGSALYYAIEIENSEEAKCGNIAIEVIGAGLTSIPIHNSGGPDPANNPTSTGDVTASAVATCNGEEITLATTKAKVTDGNIPYFSKCYVPQYVERDEAIANLNAVLIKDPSNCGEIEYSLNGSPATSLNISTSQNSATINLTAKVICDGSELETSCSNTVTVVDKVEKITCGEDFTFPNGPSGIKYFEFRCDDKKNDYWIDCKSPADAQFTLSAEGETARSDNDYGGANLPGNPNPILRDDGFYYYPKRVLATVTSTGGPYTCTSW